MSAPGILFVGHEATRTGAPIALLHFVRWFKVNQSRPFSILLAQGGELTKEFQALAETFVMDRSHFYPLALPARILRNARLSSWAQLAQATEIKRFARRGSPTLVYANSIASARAVNLLAPQVPVLTHVHELEFSFRAGVPRVEWGALLEMSQQFIACSKAVSENLVDLHGVAEDRVEIVHESIPVSEVQSRRTREEVLRELEVPSNALLVLAVGSICWRKGTDLFVQIVRAIRQRRPEVPAYFAWLGSGEHLDTAEFEHDVRVTGLKDSIRLLGTAGRPADYLAAADVSVLPSREDPYPLACLEAAALGKPIVCFGGAGGMPEFVDNACGFVVPYLDITSFADRVVCLLDSPTLRAQMGAAARDKVQRHDISIAAPQILDVMERVISESR